MLIIQDPTEHQSTHLLDSLLEAFRDATRVCGMFSFASAEGIKLLTQDEVFREVAQSSTVDLVVGIDAVTNEAALDSLLEVSQKFPNVNGRAFLNPRPHALFHPKYCWSRREVGGHLVVGSGNLTVGGLLSNWEAYAVDNLSADAILEVENTWNRWTATHAASLRPLTDPDVRRLAANNTILSPEGDRPTLIAALPNQTTIGPPNSSNDLIIADADVLIAEIPKNRPGQANFHLRDYDEFFGAAQGRLLLFQQVNPDGTMAEFERSRPPVTVASRNFRLELSAMRGRSFPRTAWPIGVFVKAATRTFYYAVLYPGDNGYDAIENLLSAHYGARRGARRLMRSVRLSLNELQRGWSNGPFWALGA